MDEDRRTGDVNVDAAPQGPADGRGRPRVQDVAAAAGVSIGTVSNVLNHPHKVREATRAKVLGVIEALGFSPNTMASSLARGDTGTLGLVIVDLGNSMFVDVARGAQRRALADGLHLQLASADNDDDLFDTHMRVLNGARVRGLLIAPLSGIDAGVERSRRHGCPVVVLNHDALGYDACRVLVDNERVGRLAVNHLLGLGRRRPAVVYARPHVQPVARRLAGARAAAAEAGVTLTEIEVPTLDPPHGTRAARLIASTPPDDRPDAVLAVTDVLGMAVVNELAAEGIAVPDDIAVMGCDHNSAAWGGTVPLTSVTMEGETMGAEGVRLLLRELAEPAGTHTHTTVVLQPRVVPRESTVGRARRA